MAEEGAGMAPAMPKQGDFCWTEIAVTDLEKCRAFYENVFGWYFRASANSGEEMEYLEFSSSGDGRMDAAIYEMNPHIFSGQVPPSHIAQYVAVDNVDEAVEKVKALGGSLCFGPYDIPNVGRIAVINDPTGASISLITFSEEHSR